MEDSLIDGWLLGCGVPDGTGSSTEYEYVELSEKMNVELSVTDADGIEVGPEDISHLSTIILYCS